MRASRRLARFLRPYRAWVIAAPVSMALEVALDLAQPRLLQTLVDRGLPNHDLELVLRLGGIMVVLAILGAFAGIGCTIYATRAAMDFGRTSATPCFERSRGSVWGSRPA